MPSSVPHRYGPSARDWSWLFPSDQLRLAAFIVRLPWQLPINSGSSFAFVLDGDLGPAWDQLAAMSPVNDSGPLVDRDGNQLEHNLRQPFMSVRVWQRSHAGHLPDLADPISAVADQVFGLKANVRPPGPPPPPNYQTVVELVTQAGLADVDREAPDVASACFERCLRGLNRLLLAYATSARDPEFEFASPRSLDPVAMLATRPLNSGYDRGPVLYLLNLNVPAAKTFLDPAAMSRVSAFTRLVTIGNPFIQSTRLGLAAQRAHRAGDNASQVIALASVGELLLNTVLRLLLVEEGKPLQAFADLAGDPRGGLKLRVRRDYHERLGGNWDPDDPGTAVGGWWHKTQSVRGRVIHGGYWPQHGEADEASTATQALERFINERLAASLRRYPKTALSKLGREGLTKLGVASTRVSRVLAAHDATLQDLWRTAGIEVDARRED
jgi:hypothetical protein